MHHREPVTGKPTTPLRLLIKQFPDLAERIFDRCVKANYHTDATTAWQANTKLDAAPISPDDPKFSGKPFTSISVTDLQGDTSGSSQPPVDI